MYNCFAHVKAASNEWFRDKANMYVSALLPVTLNSYLQLDTVPTDSTFIKTRLVFADKKKLMAEKDRKTPTG